jgi:hypothetical protein
MTSAARAWLPSGSIFLEKSLTPPVRPHRPFNQGDIFQDITITITNRANSGEPKPKGKPGHAMLMGHPCSLRGGAQLANLQNVAEVRPIKDSERERFREPWDSDFKLFPLEGFVENDLGSLTSTNSEQCTSSCSKASGWHVCR